MPNILVSMKTETKRGEGWFRTILHFLSYPIHFIVDRIKGFKEHHKTAFKVIFGLCLILIGAFWHALNKV